MTLLYYTALGQIVGTVAMLAYLEWEFTKPVVGSIEAGSAMYARFFAGRERPLMATPVRLSTTLPAECMVFKDPQRKPLFMWIEKDGKIFEVSLEMPPLITRPMSPSGPYT